MTGTDQDGVPQFALLARINYYVGVVLAWFAIFTFAIMGLGGAQTLALERGLAWPLMDPTVNLGLAVAVATGSVAAILSERSRRQQTTND